MHDDYGCMCDLSLIQDFAEALNLSTLLLVVTAGCLSDSSL